MRIFVRTVTGNIMELDVEPRDTIAAVKDQLQVKNERLRLKGLVLVLMYAGEQLADARTLSDYRIGKGTKLTLGLQRTPDPGSAAAAGGGGGGGGGGGRGAEAEEAEE